MSRLADLLVRFWSVGSRRNRDVETVLLQRNRQCCLMSKGNVKVSDGEIIDVIFRIQEILTVNGLDDGAGRLRTVHRSKIIGK